MKRAKKRKIEKCSCEEVMTLRPVLTFIDSICTSDTKQNEYADTEDILLSTARVLELLEEKPEKLCSCEEALHLRRALRACQLLLCDEDRPGSQVDALAQCANFVNQGLKLQKICGDPGVYDASPYVPMEALT